VPPVGDEAGFYSDEPEERSLPALSEPAAMPQASAPQASAPQASAPQASAPQASAPQASAPQAPAPQASAPQHNFEGYHGLDLELLKALATFIEYVAPAKDSRHSAVSAARQLLPQYVDHSDELLEDVEAIFADDSARPALDALRSRFKHAHEQFDKEKAAEEAESLPQLPAELSLHNLLLAPDAKYPFQSYASALESQIQQHQEQERREREEKEAAERSAREGGGNGDVEEEMPQVQCPVCLHIQRGQPKTWHCRCGQPLSGWTTDAQKPISDDDDEVSEDGAQEGDRAADEASASPGQNDGKSGGSVSSW
jgi:hypothetical protein